MVSDGVLEYLQADEPDQKMCEILKQTAYQHPGQMADALMEEVLNETGGMAGDDMTILVCAVWSK